MKYRVRFRRPDGTEAWLGDSGYGPTDDKQKSPAMVEHEARHAAEDRNFVHGRAGWKYWIVPDEEPG